MNRRAFLRQVSIAAAAGLILPEIARELIAPARTILLPLRSGLFDSQWTMYEREMLGRASGTLEAFNHTVDAMSYLTQTRVVYDTKELKVGERVIVFSRPRVFERRVIPFADVLA